MGDKGKEIADEDYSSGKRKRNGEDKSGNRKRKNPNVIIIDDEDSSGDEDLIDDDINKEEKPKRRRTRKTQPKIPVSSPAFDSATEGNEIKKSKRGRPRKSNPNISPDTPPSAYSPPSPDSPGSSKKTFRTRTSPNLLYHLMQKRTLSQRKVLVDMGFGFLDGMAIDIIPSQIGRFVVESFIPSEMKIKLKNYDIKITPELVHEVLGVPLGGTDFNTLAKIKGGDLRERWQLQFESKKGYPTPKKVAEAVEKTEDEGILFKLNILVLFSNFFGLGGKGGQCRPQSILNYIREDTKIESIDWCKYVVDCLRDSKKSKVKGHAESNYSGPLTVLVLIYIHSTKCVSDCMPHKKPAIKFWSTDDIRKRQSFEMGNGGFGILDLYQDDNNNNHSSEKKMEIGKLNQNVDLLARILSDIKNGFKISFSTSEDNMRLKEIKDKFNLCIQNVNLSDEENVRDNLDDEKQKDENDSDDLDEEFEKNENDDLDEKGHTRRQGTEEDSDDDDQDQGTPEDFNQRTCDESTREDDDEDEDEDQGTPKDSDLDDDEDQGTPKDSDKEKVKDIDDDQDLVNPECSYRFRRHSLEERSPFYMDDEDEEIDDDIKAKEDQQERLMQKRKEAESLRIEEIERRKKQRLDEMWENEKKHEENMNLKEQYRGEVIQNLKKLETTCSDMASLLRHFGIKVGQSADEVKKAYKDALIKFHPDRAKKDDMRQQVEAEEMFKLLGVMRGRM